MIRAFTSGSGWPEHDARNLRPPRPNRARGCHGQVRALARTATGGANRSSRSWRL